jgi:transposase
LLHLVREKPTATTNEYAAKLEAVVGVRCSGRTIARYLKRNKITVKKPVKLHPKVFDSPELRQKQEAFINEIRNIPWGRRQYMDEKTIFLSSSRTVGRAERGRRIFQKYDFHQAKKKVTLLCLLQYKPTQKTVNVLYSIQEKGNSSDENIMYFMKNTVFPAVREGDVLIMDNLGGGGNKKNPSKQHYNPEIRATYTKKRAEIKYLPPYSPLLNPIELFFGWIQRKLDSTGPYHNREQLELMLDEHIEELTMVSTEIVDGFYRQRADGRELQKFWAEQSKITIP